MSEVLSVDKHDKMDETSNVHIVAIGNDGIIIRDSKELTEKGEEIKTTEYFLDVEDQHIEEGDLDAQYVTVENVCKENESQQFIAVDVDDSSGIILEDKEVILWNELCRICANGSDRFVPIFSDEGLEHDLCNKIQTYLPLEVTENDSLPHQLCYNCAATLLAWHDMFKGCLDAQQRLEEMQNKFHLKDQDYNDSANEEENIHIAPEVETNIEESKIHSKEIEDVQMEQIIDEPNSDRDFSSYDENEEQESQDANQKQEEDFVYMCGVCDEFYESEQAVMRHMRSNHSEHINTKTLNPVCYECHICFKTYRRKQYLVKHLESHTVELPGEDGIVEKAKIFRNHVLTYKCDNCGQSLTNRRAFIRHVRMHADEKPIVCDECGKRYRIEGDLKRHVNDVHRKIKRFPCDICGTFFAAKITRDAHRRIHTGEKPFACDQCGKYFRSVNLLGVHKHIHTDYRPYECSYCQKTFRNRQKVTIHERTHTGDKPFPCDICNKMFSSKGEVMRHRTIHSNEKPYLCSECGLRFRLNRYLRMHIKQHHPDKAEELLNSMQRS